jgi:hypothetical protein
MGGGRAVAEVAAGRDTLPRRAIGRDREPDGLRGGQVGDFCMSIGGGIAHTVMINLHVKG